MFYAKLLWVFMSRTEYVRISRHNYAFSTTFRMIFNDFPWPRPDSMIFHIIFHDFPWPRPDSRTFQSWKMCTWNSAHFYDFQDLYVPCKRSPNLLTHLVDAPTSQKATLGTAETSFYRPDIRTQAQTISSLPIHQCLKRWQITPQNLA